jgi:hypothetical protein
VVCVVCCVLCVVCVGLQNAGKCKIPPSISTGCTVTTRNDGPMVHATSDIDPIPVVSKLLGCWAYADFGLFSTI